MHDILKINKLEANSTFMSWFQSDREAQIETILQSIKELDNDLYFLIVILRKQENTENFNAKILLERNACKFEYWFMIWLLIKNKQFG